MKQPPALPEHPQLRPGCHFMLHEFDSGPSWVLENPTTGKFFRMGLREERLARKLDGSRTIPQILSTAPEVGDEEELSKQEILVFLQTLSSSRLLQEAGEEPARKAPIFNPMFMRIPFGSPDRIISSIEAALRRLPPRLTLAAIGLLVLSGAYALFANLDRFTATMGSVLSTANIPAFVVCFLFLKLVHETAHGVVCKHFGGRVPDAGLYFIFFVPLTYIDATAMWRFPSKWVRILVSSAGMLAELVVAAAAALIWAWTPVGSLNTLASHTVIVASVTTLFFNANPLMRFDGYFIIADLSGVPNLYAVATRAASSFLGRILFGIPPVRKYLPWITLYGLACMFWRVTVVIGICVGAIALLNGIGIALALLTLGASYLPLFRRIPSQLAALKKRGVRLSRVRIAVLATIVLIILFVPIDPPPTTPAEIEPFQMTTIRVQCPGFVREIAVQPGQTVTAGQLLVRLENHEEQAKLDKLTTDARSAEAKGNALREANEPSEMSQQQEQASGLRNQAKMAQTYLDTLSVTAPHDGMVYSRRLEELDGAFLPTGREVLSVGSVSEREAHIAISQDLFDRIRPAVGQKVQIFVPGRLRTFNAEVTTVEPTATRDIRFESLTALAGGPMAVITKPTAGNNDGSNRPRMELVDPYFYVTVHLRGDQAEVLRSGESGIARFPSAPRQTLFSAAVAGVRAFILKKAQAADRPAQSSSS